MNIVYLIIAGLILLIVIFIYNKLTKYRQSVSEAWSDIDVQLKRRHDLIPNLVDVVKKYSEHEKKLIEEIAQLRTQALGLSKNDISQKSEVENNLEKHLKQLIAWAESYPNLKANENFLKLQEELTETEDQIASARRIYNSNVADYNVLVESFPSNIIAKLTNFKQYQFFENK